MPIRFSNKQSCRGSGSRDSKNSASSIFKKAILLGVWLSRFEEQCLFDFWERNPVGSLAFEIRRAVHLRFLRKQSCWESGSRDSDSGVFSIFEQVILLEVWLSRFGERCLFDF
ncbi:hypothetical protein TB2_007099 [Malus domestica]